MILTQTTRARFRAAIVVIGPAVLLAGHFYHPYIDPPTDPAALAAAAASDTTRWGIAHVVIGLGFALVVLAFLAVRSFLREAGEERWSGLGLPFIVVGGVLFAMLPGMEFATLAAARTGADVQAAQTALFPWFVPILLTAALTFGLGAISFAVGILRSGVLDPAQTRLVVGALVVMSVARVVPLAPAGHVVSLASVVALWPLAYEMWERRDARPAGGPQPTLAS
jgi:hypothetical protein